MYTEKYTYMHAMRRNSNIFTKASSKYKKDSHLVVLFLSWFVVQRIN